MKPGKLLTITGLIVCICLTFWQKDNLKAIWDEYWALHKSYFYNENDYLVPRIPAIEEKIAKTDPEAAAIVNYKLDYNLFSLGDEYRIEVLSKNILKFPDNQYFIYLLAWFSFDHLENGLDPAILLKLSNRLIELDSKNSNYYYLKAYALFCNRKNNNFDEAAEIIKQANECEYFEDPYSLYLDRVMSIARKQGLHNHLIQELDFEWPYNPFIKKVYETLIRYQNLLITEDEFAKAGEISSLLNGMLKNNMREPMSRSLPHSLYSLGGGFGRWNLPQEVELQHKNLTQQEADRKRLEICAIVNPEKKLKTVNKYYEPSEKTQLYAIAVLPFVYFVRMAGAFIFLAAILSIFLFSRKDNLKIKIGKAGLARFLIYGSVYFLAGQFIMIAAAFDVHRLGHCHISYMDILFLPPFLPHVDWDIIKDLFCEPYSLFLFVFPLTAVFFTGILKFFKPKFDNIVSRFICGIMIAIPLGIITTILQGYTYLKYLPVVVFILFAFKYSFRKITLRSIFKALGGSCKNEIPVLRADLLKLSVIAAVLCWFGFVILAYPTKKSIEGEAREYKYYTYSFTLNREKAYQEILKRIDDVNLPMQDILRCVPLVKSGDLPGVMEKLKERKFPSYWAKESSGFRPLGSRDYDELTEQSLLFLLRYAGKDQMPVIIKYMDNPDDGQALVFRAQLGDKSVKEKLINLYNEAIKEESDPAKIEGRYKQRKLRASELLSALIAISKPDEALTLLKEYYEIPWAARDRPLFVYESICTLPKDTVLKAINLYLDKVEHEIRNPEDNGLYNWLYTLRDLKGLYWDSQIAKRVLSLILLASDNDDKHLETFGIEYYLTHQASDLLIKGLQSDNENLRAWCLWQLRKIGYKWNETELRKIAEDKNWKVRANLALIDKSLIKENEPSAYVKLIKSM